MKQVVFYEKTGCVGNARQKDLLRSKGVALQVCDLLKQLWTPSSLRPFFGNKPVSEWFNDSAPMIKSGELNIHACNEAQAIKMMIANPILIRRPLMRIGESHQSGFSDGPVLSELGLVLESSVNLQSCPMVDSESAVCEEESA